MFKSTDHKLQGAKLTHLLACYQNQQFTSIEHYDCKDMEEHNQLPAATPLSVDTANIIFKHLQLSKGGNISFKGMMPKTLLFCDPNTQKLVWKVNARKQQLFFDNPQFKDDCYPIPTLIFSLVETTLYVFSVKTNNPTQNTQLYYAPFLNVWNDGKICMGTATIDKSNVNYFEDLMDICEYQFFNSKFTHTNHDNITKQNIIELYKEIKQKKAFPKEVLLKANNTKLSSLWN